MNIPETQWLKNNHHLLFFKSPQIGLVVLSSQLISSISSPPERPAVGGLVWVASTRITQLCFMWSLILRQANLALFPWWLRGFQREWAEAHQISWGLGMEWTQPHLCHFLLAKTSSHSREEDLDSIPQWELLLSHTVKGVTIGHTRIGATFLQSAFHRCVRVSDYNMNCEHDSMINMESKKYLGTNESDSQGVPIRKPLFP